MCLGWVEMFYNMNKGKPSGPGNLWVGRFLTTSANSSGVIVEFREARWVEEILGICRDSKKESKFSCVKR